MCEVFSAPLYKPALTLTSWLTLLSSCIGDKFNDFLKVIQLINADLGLELLVSTPRTDVTALCWLPVDLTDCLSRSLKLTIEFYINNCSFISRKALS